MRNRIKNWIAGFLAASIFGGLVILGSWSYIWGGWTASIVSAILIIFITEIIGGIGKNVSDKSR